MSGLISAWWISLHLPDIIKSKFSTEVSALRQDQSGLWRVVYIARGERQAENIESMLTQAGFLVDRKRSDNSGLRQEDIEIKVLDAEAEEARLYLMEQGL